MSDTTTDPTAVQAAVANAIEAARPTPVPPAPVANCIVTAEGRGVDFDLSGLTSVHFYFEREGAAAIALVDRGTGTIGACDQVGFPAVLQRTDVQVDLGADPPVFKPAPIAVGQDGELTLPAGRYTLSMQDHYTARFFVIGVQGAGQ